MSFGQPVRETIQVDDDGDGVAVVWLDRPDRGNAFTFTMQAELHEALASLDARNDVSVIVVTGRGRFFSTGADMEAGGSTFAQSASETDRLRRIMKSRPRPWNLRTPVVGALNGAAVGLGLTLPMQWDVRFMAAEAKYGFVFPRRGLTPEAASSWLLPRLIGRSRATELLLSGRLFTGQDAERWGLASQAVPAGDVLSTALQWAHEAAVQCSPVALAAVKHLALTAVERSELESAWSRDWELFRWIGRLPDAQEGVTAFLEKRDPCWGDSKNTALPAAPTTPWSAAS